MDTLDQQLIRLLQLDGRVSNTQLASKLGISEGTVRRRLKHLFDNQIVRVVAISEPSHLGNSTEALVGIQVDPNQVDKAANQLAKLDCTQWATITTGAYDVMIWVAVPSTQDLSIFLRQQVGNIPGVIRTETFVSLAVKKRAHAPTLYPTTEHSP